MVYEGAKRYCLQRCYLLCLHWKPSIHYMGRAKEKICDCLIYLWKLWTYKFDVQLSLSESPFVISPLFTQFLIFFGLRYKRIHLQILLALAMSCYASTERKNSLVSRREMLIYPWCLLLQYILWFSDCTIAIIPPLIWAQNMRTTIFGLYPSPPHLRVVSRIWHGIM